MNSAISNIVLYIGQVNIKDLINIFSTLLTLLIAIFTAFIAHKQSVTSEIQKRQSLFEMRYDHLYKEIIDVHTKMMQLDFNSKNLSGELLNLRLDFLNKFEKYKFLLKKKDEKIISKTASKWTNIIKDFSEKMKTDEDVDIEQYKQDQLNCINIINKTLEPYLRIE